MEAHDIFKRRQEEIDALSSAIAAHDKKVSQLKPAVTEYNDALRSRKELRKQLAARQREAQIVAAWFKGTTIIDERFPLFAHQNQSTEPITT
ncbi:hypothetical protein [Zoogloea sp.]|uniref:hypothetical protein n=1 Tax=Zoogloea sp. TaxID=49181 RepID=UPI0014166EE0|nr:MAG: hypothetical protein F9K15_12845 [Zoogloea sp.]